MKKIISSPTRLIVHLGLAVGIVCGLLSAQAQTTATYAPNAWVVDPFSPNVDDGVLNPNTSSPTYTNNGVSLNGNMFGYSPIGANVTLAKPGDTVKMTSQITLAGNVNASGNVQFRVGLLEKGASASDTGWAGYLISNPTGSGGGGLYLRNIPNTGSFGSGTGATQPTAAGYLFTAGWAAATYNFTLSITYLSTSSTLMRWTIQGISPNAYLYSGRYTNAAAATQGGFSFDTVGFLGGGSTWSSTSAADAVTFSNVQVTLGSFDDGTWANDAGGLWSATNNWVNGVPANGSGFIANFSQVALTANRTVTLDTPRTVGSLVFGATSGSVNNWIVSSTGGSALTLDNNGLANAPGSVAVNQNTATLNLSVISTNGLTETGPGLLVLGGNNTITGPLNLNGGELNFSSLANLPLTTGISAINFRGGALQWAAGNTFDISSPGIPISFAGNAGFDTGGNNVTLASGFGDTGVGGLTKLGAGQLTLNNFISYTGATTVSKGVLALGSSGNIAASSNIVVLAGATFDVSAQTGGLSLSQNFSGAGAVNGSLLAFSSFTFGAGYAATGSAGTLSINGNLTLDGAALNFGLTNLTAVGGGTNDLIAVSGNLDITTPTVVNVNLTAGAPGLGTYILFTYGSLTAGSAANLIAPLGFSVVNDTVGKTIGLLVTHVPQSLTWKGDGSANVWDTDTTEDWLQSGNPAFFFSGDSVTFDDTGSENPFVNINAGVSPASVTVNTAQTYDFAGAGAIVTGKLTKTGSGTLILENNNTYANPTVISGGVLQVGGPNNFSTTGTLGTGPVTNNAALVFNLGQNYTVATNIYGTGSITNLGTAGTITLAGAVSGSTVNMAGSGGAMVLSASNNYTGQTIVSAGSLHPRNNWALGSGTAGTVVSNGAQLYIDANVNITNKPLSLAGGGITGDGALRKGGGGVTTFGGLITLTGDTQFQVDGNSTLNLTNAAGITGSANATSTNLILGADAGGVGTISGPLNLGVGTLTVQDAGTWTIAPTNTYTGLTVINGGTLQIVGTNAGITALGPLSAFNPAYVTLGGGILGVTTNVTFADGLRGFTLSGAAGGFDVGNGATLTISNQITGSGTLTKSDGGTLVLSGSNSFSGTLNVDSGANAVNDGILLIANPNAITNVVTPIAIRNSLGGASTFELSGANGNIFVTQDITLNGRSPSIPAIVNATGTNSLAGNLTGGNGGSQYRIESDSGLLTLGSSGTLLTFTTADPQTFIFQGNGSFSVAGVIADGTAATLVEKDGAGAMTLAAANTYSGATTVTGGALLVTGSTGTGAVNVTGGTLGGTGVIGGSVAVGAGATLSPGAPLGTLTINGALTLAGNTLVAVNKTSGGRSQVAGPTSVAYGGTLTVTNLGSALAPGDTFQIFPATSSTGNFAGIAGPGGFTFTFAPSTGVLTVGSGVSTTPTNLLFTVSGGNMNFSWPADHLGWALQTNSINVGVSADWFTYPGSTNVTSESIPINPTGTVFFRMFYHP